MKNVILFLLILSAFVSCGEDGKTTVTDKCKDVNCTNNSHCDEGICICDDLYHNENDVCTANVKNVDCIDNAPENATSIITSVEINWVNNQWETPSNCEWNCNQSFYNNGNSCDICLNGETNDVLCGLNDNGTQSQICENGIWESTTSCTCGQGYEGGICENDINECENDTHNCPINADCTNAEGSFSCECKEGFLGNGYICDDVNECLNETNVCQEGYVCANQTGSFDCNDFCGNDIITVNEDCEDGNLNSQTCVSLGYSAGDLTCNSCEFKTNNCRVTRQWGTPAMDIASDIKVDSNGNIFVSGYYFNATQYDIFLIKYNSNGLFQWIRQWGSSLSDRGTSLTIDTNGNVFVTGITYGNLDDILNSGGIDSFITKFDNNGNKIWTKLYGTSADDSSKSITNDLSGNLYITGSTNGVMGETSFGGDDVFIIKTDNEGNVIFAEQTGSSTTDISYSVNTDLSGNIYIAGETYGAVDGINFGQNDSFAVKFDSNGNKLWSRQFGTSNYDFPTSGTVDSNGNFYIFGTTFGNLDGNTNMNTSCTGTATSHCNDPYLVKFDTNGNKLWTKQFGTSFSDSSYDISINSDGTFYVSGGTFGTFEGNVKVGSSDIYLLKLDNTGNVQWAKQWGTTVADYAIAISVNDAGNIYIAGLTDGSLDGNSSIGSSDVFLSIYEAGAD